MPKAPCGLMPNDVGEEIEPKSLGEHGKSYYTLRQVASWTSACHC
jgi:hypothetical protein